MFDPKSMRDDFPALSSGTGFFDAPGGMLVPSQVAAEMQRAITRPTSSQYVLIDGFRAADAVARFRAAVADLVGADPGGVVHGRSATALAFDLARTLSAGWAPGDNIVLSDLEHDSNATPWVLAAERAGVTVRWARFDADTGELPVEQYESLIDDRTRLVAVTAASNLIGTRPDVAGIAQRSHARGALVFVDGVHFTSHAAVDVTALGADFFTFSPYKLFGPHFGVLVAAPKLLEELTPDKLLPSPNQVPLRYELGTLPYELLAGFTASVDYLASLASDPSGTRRERVLRAMHEIELHENAIHAKLEAGLEAMPRVTSYSKARRRTSTTLISIDGCTDAQVVEGLLQRGLVTQSGTFYAHRASERLGLGALGGVRIGLAPYNTEAEIDRLLVALEELVQEHPVASPTAVRQPSSEDLGAAETKTTRLTPHA